MDQRWDSKDTTTPLIPLLPSSFILPSPSLFRHPLPFQFTPSTPLTLSAIPFIFPRLPPSLTALSPLSSIPRIHSSLIQHVPSSLTPPLSNSTYPPPPTFLISPFLFLIPSPPPSLIPSQSTSISLPPTNLPAATRQIKVSEKPFQTIQKAILAPCFRQTNS